MFKYFQNQDMKKLLLLVISFCFLQLNASDNTNFTFNITKTNKGQSFIENVGQFDEFETDKTGKIMYAVDFGSTRIFFGESGVSFNFLEAKKLKRSDREEILAKQSKDFYDHKRKERLVGKFMFRNDEVVMEWLNASANVQLNGIGEKPDYHSYYYKTQSGAYENANFVKGFDKIEYKNIYPNIDLIYEIHPVSGVKYAFVVHPGADPSLIKMKYDREISLFRGKILIPTQFGDITDHNPLTFYQGEKHKIIDSKFSLENNEVSFKLGNYNHNKTLVIDPWTQTPVFNLNWQNVWECDRDGAGNVYVIGGIMPMQLLKYDPAGTLQWTYNTPYDTSNSWLGTLTTDVAGNSYITSGSTARIQKINTNAGVVWNNPNPGGILSGAEFWNITFNCDQSRLVIGGTGGPVLGLEARIFNVDVNTGNVTAQIPVAIGPMIGLPPALEEVRAICPNPNGRYYFITHDTIGYIYDDFSFCGNNNFGLRKEDHGMAFGYKCENWRQDNSGIKAMKSDADFLYINRGNQLQKRSLVDFSIIATAAIPNGGFNNVFLSGNSVSNSGIDIDQCGNVYVGSGTRVHKFDSNLNLLQTFNVSYNVYDVRVSTNGDVIVCGGTGTNSSSTRSGGVSSIAAGACASLVVECCNAAICEPDVLCQGDAPITLVPATPGGTWSGPGVNSSGLFNPALAGVGIHTIVYTLPCGSDSVQVSVSSCLALDVCVETNGQLTVTGATQPVNWEFFQPAGTQPITTQAQCVACGFSWTFGQCLNGIFPVTSCNVPAQWVSFGTTTTVNAPATFPIRVTDAVGNIAEYTSLAVIPPCTQCPAISVSVSALNNVSCNGLSDGSATVAASGGTAPYSYTWQPGNLNGATQNNLASGTYTVTATDADLCTGTTTVNITQPSPIQIAQNSTNTSCGNNNGSINLTVTGGSGSYTYSWLPNVSTSASASNLAAGDYTITVNDGNCTQQTTINIATSTNPVINSISSTNETCLGDNNGTVTATASGGSGALTFTWQPGNLSGASQTGLAPGNYTLTVADASGCLATQSVVVAAGPNCCSLSLTYATTNATCGNADGSINVTIAGAVGPLTFSWSNGASTEDLVNVTSGTYTLTVTDNGAAGVCQIDTTIILSDSDAPNIVSITPTNPSCPGECDGSITVVVSGGTPPYSYQWFDGSNNPIGTNSPTINALCQGNYSVEVTDAAGASTNLLTNSDFEDGTGAGCACPTGFTCVNDAGQVFDGIHPNYVVGNTGCVLQPTNYTSSLGAHSGTGYVYFYAGADRILTTQNFSFAGGEQVEICVYYSGPQGAGPIGQNGPLAYFSFGINGTQVGPQVFVPTNTPWTQHCFTVTMPAGNSNFNILSGGAAQYTFWFDDFTVTQQNAGTGCPAFANTTLTDSTQPDASFTFNDFCAGAANGPSNIATAGGTFAFNPPATDGATINATTGEISNAVGGNSYSVEYTTPGACSNSSVQVVSANAVTITSISAQPETCPGSADGSVTATAAGNGTLTYTWQPGNLTGALQTGLVSGDYTLTVSDALGCSATQQVTIQAGDGPQLAISNIVNPTCAGNDGSFTLSLNGGTAPYTVTANAGGNVQTITVPFEGNAPFNNLPSGTVSVEIEDANGCTASQTITLSAPANCCDLTLVSISGIDETCGDANGSLEVVVSPVSAGLIYSWSNGANTATVANVSAGTYNVTVTDPSQSNCSVNASVTINNTEGPQLTDILTNGETCLGDADGTAVAVVTGGTPPYSFNWNGVVTTEELQGNLAAGTYTLTVSDQNCSVTETFEIAPGIQPGVFAGNDTSIRSGETITLNAEVNNATTGTFVWAPSLGLSCADCQSPVATPLSDIVYTVTFTDEETGCSASDNISISIIPDNPFCLFPDAFSPNNDNINDVFREICEGITFIELKVYNRWGELVYQESGTNQLRGWDGIYKNRKAPLDVYVFHAYIEYNNGTNESVMGNVSLIR